jgi:hypothetical protein
MLFTCIEFDDLPLVVRLHERPLFKRVCELVANIAAHCGCGSLENDCEVLDGVLLCY